jgi:hypothetical protein
MQTLVISCGPPLAADDKATNNGWNIASARTLLVPAHVGVD